MIGIWDQKVGKATVDWGNGLRSTYALLGDEPYTSKAGKRMSLRLWQSNCVACGAVFAIKTSGEKGLDATDFGRRTCDEHKAARRFGAVK